MLALDSSQPALDQGAELARLVVAARDQVRDLLDDGLGFLGVQRFPDRRQKLLLLIPDVLLEDLPQFAKLGGKLRVGLRNLLQIGPKLPDLLVVVDRIDDGVGVQAIAERLLEVLGLDHQVAGFTEAPDGTPLSLYTLRNRSGMVVKITNYGGIITEMHVPDRHGNLADVTFGFDEPEPYFSDSPYFGALIGRYGNRISGGRFQLDGRTVQLDVNNGPNHLHGGVIGWDKVVWSARPIEGKDPALELTYRSEDGDQAYPGNVVAKTVLASPDGFPKQGLRGIRFVMPDPRACELHEAGGTHTWCQARQRRRILRRQVAHARVNHHPHRRGHRDRRSLRHRRGHRGLRDVDPPRPPRRLASSYLPGSVVVKFRAGASAGAAA